MTSACRGRFVPLLLLISTFLFLVLTAQPLHLHQAGQPGFYDAECPLAELAAPGGETGLAPSPITIWVGLTAGAVLLIPTDDSSATPALASDSRAPPLA
jgi:hypothetical protein